MFGVGVWGDVTRQGGKGALAGVGVVGTRQHRLLGTHTGCCPSWVHLHSGYGEGQHQGAAAGYVDYCYFFCYMVQDLPEHPKGRQWGSWGTSVITRI